MKQILALKVGAAVVATGAVVAGGVALTAAGGSKTPDSVQRHWAAANESVTAANGPVNGGNKAGAGAAPAATPSASTAAIPNSNANITVDTAEQAAIDQFGQDQFTKALNAADMFVGLSHGDCNRLSGQSDPSLAMDLLFTPDALAKFTDPSTVLWIPPAGMKFPDQDCASLNRTTWTAKVEGTDDPTLWLTGTAVTTLRPTGSPTFKVTQQISLGLVPMPSDPANGVGNDFGWQINDAHIGKAQTS